MLSPYPTIVRAGDITGTNIPNTIYGTMGDDKILGMNWKDDLFGMAGNDIVHGDDGNDKVVGDLWKDTPEGNNGDDVVSRGSGADKINGGEGNDINPVDGDSASPGCEIIIAETSE
jgi:Ca2+-binding RTX toxin-like protein